MQEDDCESVDYFHVELDQHSVILAEGAPSESFLEDGNRGQFYNSGDRAAMYSAAGRSRERCAPWVASGGELEEIQRNLADVAGMIALAA